MLGDLTINDVFYRLYRLRRLIAVAALVPVIPLGMAIFAGVWVGWWLWALWVIAVAVYAAFFPNGWADLMAISVSFGLVLFFSTIVGAMGVGAVVGTPLALIAWFALWLACSAFLPMLDRFAYPVDALHHKARLPVDAATARAAFFYRPGAKVGYHQCGELEPGGVFTMTTTGGTGYSNLIEDFTGEEAPISDDVSFLAKVVSRDETTQETVFITDFSDDDMDVLTTVQSIEPAKKGCLYQKVEAGHGMGFFTGAGFWLNDIEGDVVRAAIDAQLGQATPALRSAHRDSILFVVGRFFARRQENRLQP